MGNRVKQFLLLVLNHYIKWEAKRLFERSMKLNPAPFNAYIEEVASSKGATMASTYLSKQGILHCFMCPSRQRLRKVVGEYACPAHQAEAAKLAVQSINGVKSKEAAHV